MDVVLYMLGFCLTAIAVTVAYFYIIYRLVMRYYK